MRIPLQKVPSNFLKIPNLFVLRLDLIDKQIKGNKYFKLKYNILEAQRKKVDFIVTFGGAYSNHILSTAKICALKKISSIGIIRGEELEDKWQYNTNLSQAKYFGMNLHFVTREEYRDKSKIINKFYKNTNSYVLPEGGTNHLAVKGCAEILKNISDGFRFIFCPIGTGGTFAGLVNGSINTQTIIGYPVLKNYNYLIPSIKKFIVDNKKNYCIRPMYHFGGFAKLHPSVKHWSKKLEYEVQFPIDPIYTTKTIFGFQSDFKRKLFQTEKNYLWIYSLSNY